MSRAWLGEGDGVKKRGCERGRRRASVVACVVPGEQLDEKSPATHQHDLAAPNGKLQRLSSLSRVFKRLGSVLANKRADLGMKPCFAAVRESDWYAGGAARRRAACNWGKKGLEMLHFSAASGGGGPSLVGGSYVCVCEHPS